MQISSQVTTWLWVGFYAMAIGTALIYLIGSTLKQNQKHHAYLAMIITTIAALAYYAMANGQGVFLINGKEIFVSRYIDWLLTTPLLLLSLWLIAFPAKEASKTREKIGLFSTVIFADIVMVVTGLFASMSSNPNNNKFWFVISFIAFLVIIVQMYGPVRKQAKALGASGNMFFNKMLNYLMFLWLFYPLVWLLGTSGRDKIHLGAETSLYVILDVSAKVFFGLIIVMNLKGIKNIE